MKEENLSCARRGHFNYREIPSLLFRNDPGMKVMEEKENCVVIPWALMGID